MWDLKQWQAITDGQASGATSQPFDRIVFDARKVSHPEASVFIALQGTRDGHDFIKQAWATGIRNFVVSKDVASLLPKEAAVLCVPDTIHALQQMAAACRSKYQAPLLAITGSHGKTTVKEWLNQLLASTVRLSASPKSYNSQLGVALSLLRLDLEADYALFEAGISQPGEMETLAAMLAPDVGVMTGIGPPHDEGFLNRQHKLDEKLRLFDSCHTVVFCEDDREVSQAIRRRFAEKKLISWGYAGSASLRVMETQQIHDFTEVALLDGDSKVMLRFPFQNEVLVQNALHCAAAIKALGLALSDFTEDFERLRSLPLRLQLAPAIQGSTIIYDCYNADPESLEAALHFLDRHAGEKRKVVVLTDILEMGPSEVLYPEIARQLLRHDVDLLVGIGSAFSSNAHHFKELTAQFYAKSDDFVAQLDVGDFAGATILLKGARAIALERLGRMFESRAHTTSLEINLDSIARNLSLLRSRLPGQTKVMAMVKAFAYGGGSVEIARCLAFHGVDYLAVAYADEGVAIRKAGLGTPIMVMNAGVADCSNLTEYRLEPEIYSLEQLRDLTKAGYTQGKIHLKLDTGMHRLGFSAEELPRLMAMLNPYHELHIASVLTHLGAAEDPACDAQTRKQFAAFDTALKSYPRLSEPGVLHHALNTAGAIRWRDHSYSMVRLGIGLYGWDPSQQISSDLQTPFTYRTTISQLRKVPSGEGVGYGFEDAADHSRTIAVAALGYADGLPRSLSRGVGKLYVHGVACPIVGRVCMDMTLLDVTAVPEASAGDEVVIFSPEFPPEGLARSAGLIPYELLSGIPERVKRLYVED